MQIVAKNLNFLPNKLNFCCGNYSREETLRKYGNYYFTQKIWRASLLIWKKSKDEVRLHTVDDKKICVPIPFILIVTKTTKLSPLNNQYGNTGFWIFQTRYTKSERFLPYSTYSKCQKLTFNLSHFFSLKITNFRIIFFVTDIFYRINF